MFSLLFFCLDAKEKVTKEKIKAALFGLLRYFSPLKKKNSLTLKQLFLFNAPKSTSASRPKSEANLRRNIASLVRVDALHSPPCHPERSEGSREHHSTNHPPQTAKRKISVTSFYEPPTSNSEAHLSPPLGDRPLVEEREENRANFREEQKAV